MSTAIDTSPTSYSDILERITSIEPLQYGKTRNFINGAVTRLSPYISRGVISTKLVFEHCLSQGYNPYHIQKFVQELAWRDYWQQVWVEKGTAINQDLKQPQQQVRSWEMPQTIVDAETGIEAIDDAINDFYATGYMHNHVRMYVAALACNNGQCHWKTPAQWLYYHLLDADWASNALSWQWVAGANSRKKYIANQANINKYCHSSQQGTFLDTTYENITVMDVPEVLAETVAPVLTTQLPENKDITINPNLPTLLYNFYNLDPTWRNEQKANRILLLEPSVFDQYPVSDKTIAFVMALSENIEGIQVFTGEFDELVNLYHLSDIHFKEHPLNQYEGQQHDRDWMFTVKGYYPSFFAFWKKCQKEIKNYVSE